MANIPCPSFRIPGHRFRDSGSAESLRIFLFQPANGDERGLPRILLGFEKPSRNNRPDVRLGCPVSFRKEL